MSQSEKKDFDFEPVAIHSVYLDNFRKRKKQLLKKRIESENNGTYVPMEEIRNKFGMKVDDAESSDGQKDTTTTAVKVSQVKNTDNPVNKTENTDESTPSMEETVMEKPLSQMQSLPTEENAKPDPEPKESEQDHIFSGSQAAVIAGSAVPDVPPDETGRDEISCDSQTAAIADSSVKDVPPEETDRDEISCDSQTAVIADSSTPDVPPEEADRDDTASDSQAAAAEASAVSDSQSKAAEETEQDATSSDLQTTPAGECVTPANQTQAEDTADELADVPEASTEETSEQPTDAAADTAVNTDQTSVGEQETKRSQDADEISSAVPLPALTSKLDTPKEPDPPLSSVSVTDAPRENTSKGAEEKPSRKGIGKTLVFCMILALVAGIAAYLFGQGIIPMKNTKEDSSVLPPSVVSRSDAQQQETVPSETQTAASAPTATTTTATTTAATTTTTAAPVYQTLEKGQKSTAVKNMQKRLCKLGYLDEESCTGYYGDFTESRVKMFQKKAGLPQTGIADSDTLTRLYAADAPKCIG